jgi:AraC-like DNA-binding protein
VAAVPNISLLEPPRPRLSQMLGVQLVKASARRIEMANLLATGPHQRPPTSLPARKKEFAERAGTYHLRGCCDKLPRSGRSSTHVVLSEINTAAMRRADAFAYWQDVAVDTFVDLNIAQIAFAHGFRDTSHFSRAFRNRFGVTARYCRAIQTSARRA